MGQHTRSRPIGDAHHSVMRGHGKGTVPLKLLLSMRNVDKFVKFKIRFGMVPVNWFD